MRKVFLTVGTLASTALSMGFSASAFAAYDSFYPMPSVDARRGDHPYELRKEANERRRELKERNRSRGGYFSLTDIYASPARAENLQLHPFFRNQAAAGLDIYNPYTFSGRPVYDSAAYVYPRHPSTYCLNYSFERYSYHSAPTGYVCEE